MKKQKLIALACFLLLLPPFVSGQQKNSMYEPNPGLAVSLMPFSLLEASSGRCVRVGLEYRIVKRFNHYIDYSYYFPGSPGYHDLHGYRVRTDLRYYFGGDTSAFSYVGLSLMLKDQQMQLNGAISDSVGTGTYDKEYHFNKRVFAADVIFGNYIYQRGNFSVEYECGLGLRFRHFSNDLDAYEKNNLNYADAVSINSFPDVDLTLDVVASLKLVYRLKP